MHSRAGRTSVVLAVLTLSVGGCCSVEPVSVRATVVVPADHIRPESYMAERAAQIACEGLPLDFRLVSDGDRLLLFSLQSSSLGRRWYVQELQVSDDELRPSTPELVYDANQPLILLRLSGALCIGRQVAPAPNGATTRCGVPVVDIGDTLSRGVEWSDFDGDYYALLEQGPTFGAMSFRPTFVVGTAKAGRLESLFSRTYPTDARYSVCSYSDGAAALITTFAVGQAPENELVSITKTQGCTRRSLPSLAWPPNPVLLATSMGPCIVGATTDGLLSLYDGATQLVLGVAVSDWELSASVVSGNIWILIGTGSNLKAVVGRLGTDTWETGAVRGFDSTSGPVRACVHKAVLLLTSITERGIEVFRIRK